jgi:hypothetical protein
MSNEFNNNWCWIGVPFKMSFCTYDTYKYKEHPIKDKYKKYTSLSELEIGLTDGTVNIFSPTSCYFDLNITNGLFYRDQQDCVRWVYETSTGFVKTTSGRYVAKSLAEFLSHIEDDAKCWFDSNKIMMKRMYGTDNFEEFCRNN